VEKPWLEPGPIAPAFDQRRVILAGIDPADRRALEGALQAAVDATRAVRLECRTLRDTIDELRRSREHGALPAVLAGSHLEGRDLTRLARALGNRHGTVPLVAVLPAPLRELAETALDDGCSDVLIRGRLTADELARALRHAFEVSRRQRAEDRLKLRLGGSAPAPVPVPVEARRFVSLGRTLAAAGHELNNLLQPIVGYAELLLGSIDGQTRAGHYARQVERSARQASALVRRLLAAGRAPRESVLASPADARLEQLRELVERVLGPAVELRLDCGAGAAEISLAEGLLEQVVLNLAVNARDALPLGGALALRTRSEGGDSWVIEVETSGAQLLPDEPRRGAASPADPEDLESAAGLGLWLVRGLVEDAGGRVLQSEEPGALRLTLRLPVAAVAAPPAR
jgi:signal transduction histidine kinase